jgi:hypothetical protein
METVGAMVAARERGVGSGTNLGVVLHRLVHDGADLQLAFGEHGRCASVLGRGFANTNRLELCSGESAVRSIAPVRPQDS